ncbi:MAG TPA: heme exporter protein CcmB [Sphingomonas sp.]|uniref:heme exporter protein CcmB n=1 Tax=Sphingomonas sp. TaxID=28214 RepID=UPI002EDA48AD
MRSAPPPASGGRRFATLLRRDIALHYAGGAATLPILFFLLVATLFPFAVGPDGALLARTGGGALWMAALLAALLPVDRLVEPDRAAGIFDQYAVRGIAAETAMTAKLVAHWLGFAPPLMLAVLPAAALLKLNGGTVLRIEAGLALGTPGLAALGLLTAALTAGLRGAGALAGLVMLPLAIPLLIFGAGALGDQGAGALKLLAATSLLLLAITPFAAGAALKATRS